MTNSTKSILLSAFLLIIISFNLKAQTHVSGGIYNNSTWTKINSPYIVDSFIVVFPGVTLSIEAGVTIKFNANQYIELRQAALIAIGSSNDSITFTSNSNAPIPGIWNQIYLNGGSMNSYFSYCNFKYAINGINVLSTNDSIKINNSNFISNENGIGGYPIYMTIDTCNFINNTSTGVQRGARFIRYCIFKNNQVACTGGDSIINCIIDSNQIGLNTNGTVINCIIKYNQTGIEGDNGYYLENSIIDSNYIVGAIAEGDCAEATITKCEFKYNGIGIDNEISPNVIYQNVIENNRIGISQGRFATGDYIYCNKICNNVLYDFKSNMSSNFNVANNYWCSTDSATIRSHIFDGYDSIALGLVIFMPIDTVGCYLTGCNIKLTTSVTNATCDTCHNGKASVDVSNGFGSITYTWQTSPIQSTQEATKLTSGSYTVCVIDANGCTACTSVFVDSTNCTGFSASAHGANESCLSCSDGMAWVQVNHGTAPFNYTWYTFPIQNTDTAYNLSQGIYAVCVTDLYGCSACDSVTIGTGSCSAHFDLYPDTTIPHTYTAVNMASGAGVLTYDWDWGDGGAHDFTPFPSHTYSAAGFYTICLTITDTAGCTNNYCNSFYLLRTTNTMIHVNVIPPLINSVNESPGKTSFSIFPNPASDNLTLFLPENTSKGTIKIYNLLGELNYVASVTKQRTDINVSALASGVYIIEVSSKDVVERQKFIKD